MLRALKISLPSAGSHNSRRRPHQFVPSIPEAAACLEERALLSGAGGAAHAAVAAHHAPVDLAETAAGARVTAAFESILHTAPSSQQLDMWARKIRGGHATIKTLDRYLKADARTIASEQAAAANDPIVSVSPTGLVTVGTNGMTVPTTTSTGTALNSTSTLNYPGIAGTLGYPGITGGIGTLGTLGSSTSIANSGLAQALPAGLINTVNGTLSDSLGMPGAIVSTDGTPSIATTIAQIPIGSGFVVSSGTGTTLNSTSASGVVLTNGLTNNGTAGYTTGLSGTSALPYYNSTGSGTTIVINLGSGTSGTLGGLLSGTGLTPPTTSGVSAGTFGTTTSSLSFSPTTTITSPTNASPLPFTGTLPFTGSPANPSPLPLNGTLPYTDTPANPSPVPVTGLVG